MDGLIHSSSSSWDVMRERGWRYLLVSVPLGWCGIWVGGILEPRPGPNFCRCRHLGGTPIAAPVSDLCGATVRDDLVCTPQWPTTTRATTLFSLRLLARRGLDPDAPLHPAANWEYADRRSKDQIFATAVSRNNHDAAQQILARSCQRAPVCSHQSIADGNTAHGDRGSPAQDERAGEHNRGLCNSEQRDTKQDVLQPGYEQIMDQIYAIGIL